MVVCDRRMWCQRWTLWVLPSAAVIAVACGGKERQGLDPVDSGGCVVGECPTMTVPASGGGRSGTGGFGGMSGGTSSGGTSSGGSPSTGASTGGGGAPENTGGASTGGVVAQGGATGSGNAAGRPPVLDEADTTPRQPGTGGTPSTPCTTDAECGELERCEGRTVPACVPGECTDESQCPEGDSCVGGRCRQRSARGQGCGWGIPCQPGLLCMRGFCGLPPTPNAPCDAKCGNPLVCQADDEARPWCVPQQCPEMGCDSSQYCAFVDGGAACLHRAGTGSRCAFDVLCAIGNHCESGICVRGEVGSPCSGDGHCPDGTLCGSTASLEPSRCVPYAQLSEPCGRITGKSDCFIGLACDREALRCVPGFNPECGPCAIGFTCDTVIVNGHCVRRAAGLKPIKPAEPAPPAQPAHNER